jgi:sulfate permease, SulP family
MVAPAAHSLTPKFFTLWREGYGLASFKKDAVAGLTVAIVALPLSMAIAIASHAPPQAGLFTAIVGGFLVSALGGSRFQIGGPAGAFIVLVSSIIDGQGFSGLLLATMMAGAIMILAGVLRLGSLVRLVPHPVAAGFTAGIALIIFSSQMHDLFGLHLAGTEPAALVQKYVALWEARGTANSAALLMATGTIAVILLVRRFKPQWPALLISITMASLASYSMGLPVETIASRFGDIPHVLPRPAVPSIDTAHLLALVPQAFSLALLGGIESLLSAVVADKMAGRAHRSNAELVAQGIANVVVPLFGGITVTGTIARTATNVRAGAHGPVSGMLHALYLLLFMLVAAPLLGQIPLSALAGILVVVAWNMVELKAIARLNTGPLFSTFMTTFLITVFYGLMTGIGVGTLLAWLFDLALKPRTP